MVKKRILGLCVAAMLFASFSGISTAYATETNADTPTSQSEIGVRGVDIIIDQYQIINGILHVRPYNYSRNCWVPGSTWTPV